MVGKSPPAPALPVPRGEVMLCAPLEADVGKPIVMVAWGGGAC